MESIVKTDALIERVFLFLEEGDWKKANEYCERILDIDPKNAYAYLGKLMIEYHIKQKSDLAKCKKDFGSSLNYKRVLQYGDEDLALEVEQYLLQVKSSKESKDTFLTVKQNNKSNRLLPAILSTVLIIAIVVGLCFAFLPSAADNFELDRDKKSYVYYKGMQIELPVHENYEIKIHGDKIFLSCIKSGSAITICEFLSHIKAPKGKAFHATGWAERNYCSLSFLIKNYATYSVPHFHTVGSFDSNIEMKVESVDLQIYCHNGRYAGRIMNNGEPPPYYGSANNNGLLSINIPNDGTINYYFKDGETTIIGQYGSPNTTVEIKVVKQ